jgi:hypothetical protein
MAEIGEKADHSEDPLPLHWTQALLQVIKSTIVRLFHLGSGDDATDLLRAWAKHFEKDVLLLPWLSTQIVLLRTVIPLRGYAVISQLLPSTTWTGVSDAVSALFEADDVESAGPELLSKAYISEYDEKFDLAVCLILSTELNDQLITEQLIDIIQGARNAGQARIVGQLASALTKTIGIGYFREIVGSGRPLLAESARLFLAFAKFDVLVEICKLSGEIISGSGNLLKRFLDAVMPSFPRLAGAAGAAIDLISGILGSISEGSAMQLRETALDAVVLIYHKIELYDHRTRILSSVHEGFPDELWVLLRHCLEQTKVNSANSSSSQRMPYHYY